MDICKLILEIEESKMYLNNILTLLWDTIDNNPANPRIPRLQSNIPPLKTRLADLTENIEKGYFTFDSYIPSISDQQEKSNFPETPTSLRTIRGKYRMRNIYLFP